MPKAKKGILLITDVATKIYLLSLAENIWNILILIMIF